MKIKTEIIGIDGIPIVHQGDYGFAIQARKEGEQININVDWAIDPTVTPEILKSTIGGFLGNLEDIFGEKMVTEAIFHYAEDTGKLIKNGKGQAMIYFKSRGLDYK